MNVKSLRNEINRTQKSSASQSQRADENEEDEDMEDMSEENQDIAMIQQPQKRESEEANQSNKSQKQISPQVTVVLDGFTDKTEKQQLSENIASLGLILGSGLPSKLNSNSGLTVVLSNNGNYDPPQNLKSSVFVVNKQWLIDCEELKQVVTHPEKLSQYGFLFK